MKKASSKYERDFVEEPCETSKSLLNKSVMPERK